MSRIAVLIHNRVFGAPAASIIHRFGLAPLLVVMLASTTPAQDEIEFLNGTTVSGQVTKIDKAAKKVTFDSKIGSRTSSRTYSYSQIHTVTLRGKRYVLTPKASAPGPGTSASNSQGGRTKQEVEQIIGTVGASPPDWLGQTRLNYPRSLDLTWPAALSSQWNTQKNVGHFLWSVINENPSRWREGVKLMYHLQQTNPSSTAKQNSALELGEQFHNLFQDYARGAYWYRQAKVDTSPPRGNPDAPVHMANCYWKLGNKAMAMEIIDRIPRFSSIKLLADMGESQKAIAMAERMLRTRDPWTLGNVNIYAGDACRTSGQFDKAIDYYKQTFSIQATGRMRQRLDRIQNRARASIAAIEVFELTDLNQISDGSYRSNSLGYEGPVHVEVQVRSQRIESVRVTNHREKQFYSALSDTPNKIIEKQGVKGVDTTSGATITSEAIINATAKALAGK